LSVNLVWTHGHGSPYFAATFTLCELAA
jgi:hypothetical protein